ncbi:MAG: hypothetical protein K0R39_1969 [Symbiobacteriaceae bacterium]|jgi:hypothetical protein|nr:hypothetical protein [Symbiobacteriaceae bacterium]
MQRLVAALVVAALIAGCSGAGKAPGAGAPGDPTGPAAPGPAPSPSPVPDAPAAPTDPRPDLLIYTDLSFLSRTRLRDGLARLLEGPGDVRERLAKLRGRVVPPYRGRIDEIFWAEADLDGDGIDEIIFTQGITDEDNPNSSLRARGAALTVIYQKDGRWSADVSDPFGDVPEHQLMRPHLHAVTDLTGAGRPQIVWSRPHMIATGPQPYSIYVTSWTPGTFTHLPGKMIMSSMLLRVEGRDILLEGVSRVAWIIRGAPMRQDRYRFEGGAFRLVDRRFVEPAQVGYDRLWDGLVAEDVGRLADAEAAYREVLDPDFPAHSGQIWQYQSPPKELTPPDMEAFATALRTFARFRLGALLVGAGRRTEAEEVLVPEGNPYFGLTEAMRTTATRAEGCQAAAAWAEANPGFLGALNLGVGSGPWTPDILCTHVSLDDGNWR